MNLKYFMLFLVLSIVIGSASSADLTGSWSDQSSDGLTDAGADISGQAPPDDQQTYSQYSQYFSIGSEAPPSDDNIIDAESYDIKGQVPSELYI